MATKAVADAKRRIAELKATIKAAADDEAAREKAVEPAKAKYTRINARQSKALLLTQAAGEPNSRGGAVNVISLADIKLGWYQQELGKPKYVAGQLMAGEIKVERSSSSVAYTLRGMLQRSRYPAGPTTIKAIQIAVRKREAAERALADAWAVEKNVRDAAFEHGIKVEVEPVAIAIAERLVADRATRTTRDNELQQKAREAEYWLPDAEMHLSWVTSTAPGKPDECPCQHCQGDRAEAIKRRERERQLDEAPTVMEACPYHDKARHRVTIGERKARLTDELRKVFIAAKPEIEPLLPPDERQSWGGTREAEPMVPIGVCRKGKEPQAFWRVSVWYDQLVRAKKEAEKAAKVQAYIDGKARAAAEKARAKATRGKQPEPVALDGWVCPSCEETQPLETHDDDGEAWVECSMCGFEGRADVVKQVALERQAA